MPSLPPRSSDSPLPSTTPSADNVDSGPKPNANKSWRTNLALFAATAVSVLFSGAAGDMAPLSSRTAWVHGAQFAGTLLAILVAHEMGHFIAARLHRVEASLPFFLPLPLLSPFGTLGAVIRMRGEIPTRSALLDIGASGPLAGLTVAIPMYAYGIAHSPVVAVGAVEGAVELGEPVLLRLIDRLAAPAVAEGMTLFVSPVAFAAWAGMLITWINLLPVGQLDGGHVAYALFGPRQNRIAQGVHRAMLVFFFVSLAGGLGRDSAAGLGLSRIGLHVGNAIFWLVWFEVIAILGSLSVQAELHVLRPMTRVVATLGLSIVASAGREKPTVFLWVVWFAGLTTLLAMERQWGVLRPHRLTDHPTTGFEPLGYGRQAVALLTLLFFLLLFMPTPIVM